jgi:hypothetical protein
MGICESITWHSSLLKLSYLLFIVNMGAPFWLSSSLGDCSIYAGPWGNYFSGCSALGLEDGYTEYEEDPDSDLTTWQGGTSVAFLFGFFAVIFKVFAWRGDSPSKNLLIASVILSTIACLGAFISWGKVADFYDTNGTDLFINFGLQIVASFLIIPSIVKDVMEIVGGATV